MNVRMAVASGVCALAFAALVVTLNMHAYPTPISNPGDFRAFYCAGRAIDVGANPYLTEPLRSCERQAAADFGMAFGPTALIPAPLPPYAIGIFGLLGLLPFAAASNLWFLISCAALVLSIVVTWRLSAAPLPAIGVALLVAGGLVSFPEGQVAPLAVASLVLAASAMREGRAGRAGLALACAMIAPTIALPALIAALTEKSMRSAALAAIVVLAMLDLAIGGPALTQQYVTTVVPLQSRAQIDHLYAQYSLSSILWGLGASREAARFAGTCDYAAMFVLGVWTALRLRARYDDRAMLVLVPPTFVILGGTYAHLFLIVVALPLAFVFFTQVKRYRGLVVAALVGLAIPLQYVVTASPLHHLVYPTASPQRARAAVRVPAPSDIPQAIEVRNSANSRVPDFASLARISAPKITTWLAIVALIFVCLREAFGRPRAERPA